MIGQGFDNPEATADFCTLRMSQEKEGQEHFLVLYLNNQHQLIEDVVEFHGTIDGASVYPRIIARQAIVMNASAIILCHNHPSGINKPSQADKNITAKIKECLHLFDIRILDHIIIAGSETFSFANNGLV